MSENKIISFEQFKAKKKKTKDLTPIYGILVWLYCPQCKTIEYTALQAPTGRTHRCGTVVQEKEVELDLRAELTICRYNQKIIQQELNNLQTSTWKKIANKTVETLLQSYLTAEESYEAKLTNPYQEGSLLDYPLNVEEMKEKLPIVKEVQFGILISEFRYTPEKRFGISVEE